VGVEGGGAGGGGAGSELPPPQALKRGRISAASMPARGSEVLKTTVVMSAFETRWATVKTAGGDGVVFLAQPCKAPS
jgi:hypothetical protein